MSMSPPLVSRIKILANMNIVERRRAQDGQFAAEVDNRGIDVRVSTMATVFGEKCVMRILDKSRSLYKLGQLGMPRDTQTNYDKMVRSPFGMVLCAGPTGSGKTTTLYATLNEIDERSRNIVTIEDPVEYVFPTINQIQTNEQAGITFADGLRAILRQDPDVILVGEIRDTETARIATQAALTGHFVLSSLHATDSVAALHRFLDMGIEAFLVASSVLGVVSQRLVRRVCPSCAVPYEPTAEEMAFYREAGGEVSYFVRGAGCQMCTETGYLDRIGVYESLRMTPEIRRLLVGWATQDELRRVAIQQGMRTLRTEGLALVDQGVTTISEVIRSIYAL
jgi:type IV pilus assembly protein PilB